MVGGVTTAKDLEKTEENRQLVNKFVQSVLIENRIKELPDYVANSYIEHNPNMEDGLSALQNHLSAQGTDSNVLVQYQKTHRILAEGDFVLSICEDHLNGVHTSFYDLFRIEEGKIAEHWDIIDTVPPRSEWNNDNGKY